MNRPLLFVALAVSLAGNVWYLIAAGPRPATPPPAEALVAPVAANKAPVSSVAAVVSPTTGGAAASAPTDEAPLHGFTWRTPTTDDEFRALAANLRAAGFPAGIVYRVISELHEQHRRAESPLAKLPFWQRRAAQKEMQEYDRETKQQLEAILGPDARPSARLDAVARVRQYGNLPDAKIDAIAAIERDYREMQSDVVRSAGDSFNVEDWSARQSQRNLLKAEMRADLEKILTPAELAEYEMRSSDSARSIAYGVRDLSVNATEFAALYEVQRAFDAANPSLSGRVTPEQFAARQQAELARFEQMRAVLADERFYIYLAASNADFRGLTALTKQFPTVTPAAAYQALQLRYEMQQARNSLASSGALRTPEALQAAYAGWNARLDALLGPEAAAAYRKTNYGRTFNAPNVVRSATPRG
jgi:hypothetical protein